MIKILDNLVSLNTTKYLEECLLNHPWYYLKDTAYNQFNQSTRPYESSWVHFLYNDEESLSDLKPLAESLLIGALEKSDLTISKLIRIRAGMSTRTPYPIRHDPHVDWDNHHMSAVYYVNSSDGDTVFYKEKRDENLTIDSREWAENRTFTIDHTIPPVAGRMVIFDGLIYHSSTTPCNTDHRIIINFNWLP
jgi:hypothetical protein